MDRAGLVAFVRERGLAVVATTGPAGPEAALVGLAATDAGELVLDTSPSARKVDNIRASPRVAVVVGWDDEVTVQVEGVADVLDETADPEVRDRCRNAYFAQFPDGRERAEGRGVVHVRVRPEWLRHSDFRPGTFGSTETRLPSVGGAAAQSGT